MFLIAGEQLTSNFKKRNMEVCKLKGANRSLSKLSIPLSPRALNLVQVAVMHSSHDKELS